MQTSSCEGGCDSRSCIWRDTLCGTLSIDRYTHNNTSLITHKNEKPLKDLIYLPRVDERYFHKSQEIRCVRTAHAACGGSLDLQDIRCGVGVQDADRVLPCEGAVLLGLTGYWVKVLSAVQCSTVWCNGE